MSELNIPMGDQEELLEGSDDEMLLYTLVDEDGNEKQFEMVDIMKDEETGKVYCALVEHAENPEDLLSQEGELAVLEMTDGEDGSDLLIPIEDEELFNRIGEMFIQRLSEDLEDAEDEE